MRKFKNISVALLVTLSTTVLTPAIPAYAFSLNDLAAHSTQSTTTTKSASGNGIFDVLIGLLLGKLLGNTFSGGSSVPNTNATISQVLGMANTPTTTTTNNTAGSAVVATAQKYTGVPYVWGGETPAGFDCSGFTQYVLKQNGITVPRTAAEQFEVGTPIDKANLQVGDVVFFTTYKPGASHEGFYIGNNKFIHASSSAAKVTTSNLSEQYYADHYIGARRYN